MSRYHREFRFANGVHELLMPDIHKYLLGEGYEYRDFDGEQVYKKGSGWVSAPTFIKLQASKTVIIIEAWIKTALLPGVYVGESGIDGFYGAAPKGILANRVRHIEQMITNNGGIDAANAPAAAVGEKKNVFCVKCGAKNDADAKFCVKCGEKLVK